jgi:hypothetical protein
MLLLDKRGPLIFTHSVLASKILRPIKLREIDISGCLVVRTAHHALFDLIKPAGVTMLHYGVVLGFLCNGTWPNDIYILDFADKGINIMNLDAFFRHDDRVVRVVPPASEEYSFEQMCTRISKLVAEKDHIEYNPFMRNCQTFANYIMYGRAPSPLSNFFILATFLTFGAILFQTKKRS